MQLMIDSELRDLIPRPSEAERAALEASMVAEGGAREPLIAWASSAGPVLVDGHTRHEIATRLGLRFTVAERPFADRNAVKHWMLEHQFARRNLTPDQQAAIAAIAGVSPPPCHGVTPPFAAARELAARAGGGALLRRVIAGKCSVRQALNHSKRKAGELPPRKPGAAAPSAAPTLDDTIARTDAARVTRAEAALLREASARIQILEARLAEVSAPLSAPLASIAMPEFAPEGRRAGAAVALLSDVHAGAEFRSSAVTYGNAYSPEICRKRLTRWFAGVTWLVQSYRAIAWDVRDLVVWFGGDLIDGHLHDDQRETSQSAITTVDWLEPVLVAGLRSLLERLDLRLHLVCSYGNHGRDTVMPRRGTGAEHSYEWGMYQRIGRAIRGPLVDVLADPTSHQYLEVFDRTLHFTHGDECKYHGGSGGISIPLNKAFAAWDRVRPAYLHHCGHFHQQLDGGHWIANGTVKGYDAFAMSIKGAPEPPQQMFYILDAKRGKTAVSPIWVAE